MLEFNSRDAAVSYCFVLYLLLVGDAQISHALAQLWGSVLCVPSSAALAMDVCWKPAVSPAPLGFGVSGTHHLWSSFCCALFCSICSGAFVSTEQEHRSKAPWAQRTQMASTKEGNVVVSSSRSLLCAHCPLVLNLSYPPV